MAINAKHIKTLYDDKVANHYDLPISHMFQKYKKQAFKESAIKAADHVLVFCCGTGLDFPHILQKTGKQGRIIGVDFSSAMLEKARKRCLKNGWENVELIEADVTAFNLPNHRKFDAGVCTLGLSIIPDYQKAYQNLISHVHEGGEIIVGDMQLASGGYSMFNPLTVFMAKRFGGSFEGHNNTREIIDTMRNTLRNVRFKELFLKSYFYCVGEI